MNTWESLGGLARKPGWSGLKSLTVRMPQKQESELSAMLMDSDSIYGMDSGRLSLSDPDGIELLIRSKWPLRVNGITCVSTSEQPVAMASHPDVEASGLTGIEKIAYEPEWSF